MDRRARFIFKYFVLSILIALSAISGVSAQNYNRQKIERGNRKHWKSMIDSLNLKLPDSLPSPANDPRRPNGNFQKKEGSNNWYDSTGNTYIRSAWGTWNNYDESKANPYPNLPDPLKLNAREEVQTSSEWWKYKRPEIKRNFSEEIYGKIPNNVPAVHWKVVSRKDTTIKKIPAVVKHLRGHVDNSSYPSISVNIKLELVTPSKAKKAVPVIVHLGYILPPGIHFPKHKSKKPSWKVQLLNKGWGFAIYWPQTVQADNGAGLTKGIIGLVNKGKPRKPDQWGALRAWAWGADRVFDYLASDSAVNSNEVGIEGLSRFGKEALVTMAYDQRYAIALVGSSGKGGATLYRRDYGETIGILCSTGEYHWFDGNFLKYAGPLNASDLRVDSHELIAMCAPRPVFISTGNPKVEGRWMDDKGQFMAEVAAGPVYRLLGKQGLGTKKMPPMGTALISGDLAFRQHFGPHTVVPNWPYFIKFAQHYFK